MRDFLRPGKWVVIAATTLLLLATSGLSLSRMTCLKGGFSVFTLGTSFAECGMEDVPETPVWRAECCTFGQVVLDQPELHHDRAVVLSVPVVIVGLLGYSPVLIHSVDMSGGTRRVPGPRPSSERRSLIGTYRI